MGKVQFLDGNKIIIMKKTALFLLLIVTQSCFQKTENKGLKTEVTISKTADDILKVNPNNANLIENNDSIIKNLKDFYMSYITENSKDIVDKNVLKELKNKYITKNLLNKLQKLALDYDPFVNAQDYNAQWLKKIEITKSQLHKNNYSIIIDDNGKKINVSLVIVKELNQYKIDDINNLPNNIIETHQTENHAGQEVTGTWKKTCEEKKTGLLAFDSTHGYLDIYMSNDYARVSVDIINSTNIKYSVLTGITRYNKFVNWLDVSNDSIICKVKRTNESSLELEWLGFYNKKTRKREMVKNPFSDENGNKFILLKICK